MENSWFTILFHCLHKDDLAACGCDRLHTEPEKKKKKKKKEQAQVSAEETSENLFFYL